MDKNSSKILIIEDDQDINDILYSEFSSEGYEVVRAWSGTEGRLCLTQDPDIIITDLMLPGMSGEELVAFINDGTPVIVLSAKSSVEDKVKLLKLGCVDYVTKPFNINELKARVEVHLANSLKAKAGEERSDHHLISFGGLTLDSDNRMVSAEGGQAHLTRTEFAILKLLLLGRGTVISKNQIQICLYQFSRFNTCKSCMSSQNFLCHCHSHSYFLRLFIISTIKTINLYIS